MQKVASTSQQPTALAKARLPKGDVLALAARAWADSAGQLTATKAVEFLAIDPLSGDQADGPRARLAAWLDEDGDPARLLAALAGAELETYGRQSDPLPGNAKADTSQRWLDLLTRHGGYTSKGLDLA